MGSTTQTLGLRPKVARLTAESVFRRRGKRSRHTAMLPFSGAALEAISLAMLRCLVLLALAMVIAMPLRHLNTYIKQHVAPDWAAIVAHDQSVVDATLARR